MRVVEANICVPWPWNSKVCSHSIFSFFDNPKSTQRAHARLQPFYPEGKNETIHAPARSTFSHLYSHICIILIILNLSVLFGPEHEDTDTLPSANSRQTLLCVKLYALNGERLCGLHVGSLREKLVCKVNI